MTTKIKSITVKSVFGKANKKHIGEVLFNIAGFADDKIVLENKYGESIGFKGDFVAVNAETGEIFESNACFLPSGLTTSLADKINGSEGKSIEFKASIMVMESDKNDKGIAYVAEAPMTKERESRKAGLLELAASLPKAIENKK